jgi:selenocysteine lyase/cysteine desulfurase
MTAAELAAMAEELVAQLREDIARCFNREDHIRLSARATAATHILNGLNLLTGSPDDGGEVLS